MKEEVLYFTIENEDISVNMISNAIAKGLSQRGWAVKLVPSCKIINGAMSYNNVIGYNPDEVLNVHYPAHYSQISMIGKKSILQAMNDTTRFSDWYREQWISKHYKAMLVHNNLQYGLMDMPRSWLMKEPIFPNLNKVEPKAFEEREFTFFVHNDSPNDRRGFEEAMQIIKALDIKNNIYHSRHIPLPEEYAPYFTEVVNKTFEIDLYRDMAKSKFYLHATKGGSFERTVMESIALGTVPIISEVGSAREILLDVDDGVLLPVTDLAYNLYKNQFQQGNGFQTNVELAIPVVKKALETHKEISNYKRYREYYSLENVLDKYEQILMS